MSMNIGRFLAMTNEQCLCLIVYDRLRRDHHRGRPAGSAVSALLAREGMRTLLLEKSRFPREKLCGEFITPDC